MNSRLKAFFAIAFALPALLVSTLVIGTSSSAGAADAVVEDEQWPSPMEATLGLHGIILEDSVQSAGGESSVSVMALPRSTGSTDSTPRVESSLSAESAFT